MFRKFLVLFLVVFPFFVFCGVVPFEKTRLFSENLTNGMKFILYKTPETSSGIMFLCFKSGFRFDEEGFEGESKLLERLIFKGTQRIGSKNAMEELKAYEKLEEIDDEIIQYYLKGENDEKKLDNLMKQAKLLKAKADEFSEPLAIEKEFLSLGVRFYYAQSTPDFFEIGYVFPKDVLNYMVVLQANILNEAVFRNFFEERLSLTNSVLGKGEDQFFSDFLKESIEGSKNYEKLFINAQNISLKRFKEYFKSAMNPQNGVIVLIGDFPFLETYKLVNHYLGHIFSDTDRDLKINEMFKDKNIFIKTKEREAILAFKKESLSPKIEACLDLATKYFSDKESPLLKDGNIIKIDFVNGIPGFFSPSLFLIRVEFKDGIDSEKEITKIKDYLINFGKIGISSPLFEKSKKNLLFQVYEVGENKFGLAKNIAETYLVSKSETFYFEYMENIQSMNFEEFKKGLLEIFVEKEGKK